MNATRIKQLAWYMPETRRQSDQPDVNLEGLTLPDGLSMQHYLGCYSNLKFGWDFCAELVRNELPMPGIVDGDDTVLWRAYYFMQGVYDAAIESALQLTSFTMQGVASQLQALLIHPSVSIEEAARTLSIPIDTVGAYEKLFFNVVDRRADAKFIAQIVYPRTRLVEMFEDYLQNAGLSSLLLRAGYNNGPSDVRYYAGLADSPFTGLSSSEAASKLESAIMANGFMMARSGFINQAQNAIGIMHSRQVLQAAKAGGEQTTQTSNFNTIGSSILDQILATEDRAMELRQQGALIEV